MLTLISKDTPKREPVKYPKNPAGNYLFKINNSNTRTKCEICSELTVKTPERRRWRHSGVFIVKFEHILHLVIVLLLLTLSREMPAGKLAKDLCIEQYFRLRRD